MNNKLLGYVIIEDLSSTGSLSTVFDEVLELDMVESKLIDCDEQYLTFSISYDDTGDSKDLCASLVIILLEYDITKFTFMFNGSE